MEETGLINGNRKRGASSLESGKCCFFSLGLVGVLLCVIASLVLNSVIFNKLNSGIGPNSPVISYNNTEVPSLTVQHVAYSKIKKGEAVGICSDDLAKVCKIQEQPVMDSLLQSLKLSSNDDLISHVSDVSFAFTCLVQHAKQQNTQKIIFNAINSNFPIFYYSIKFVDILESIGEKPLEANESFKLMGVKIIYYESEDDTSKATNVVTFVRSSPTNDGSYLHQFKTVLVTVDQSSLKSGITVDNSTVGFSITSNLKADDEFDLKFFSIGMTQSDSPAIVLYFNSVSKGCQASVMSFQNNKLTSLNSLQKGPTNVGCNAGLNIFTYDANTIVILSYFSLAALTVNSQTGILITKSINFNYLPYRNFQFQRNLDVKFIGNDVIGKKDPRSSKFFIIFSNEANGYTQVMPLKFDGNTFTTARITAFTQSMKNVQASYYDSSHINLVYQHEDSFKSVKISFVNEQFESDGKVYSFETPTEGIEMPLKSISPMDWIVRLPTINSDIPISLLINPNGLDFQIARVSSVNTVSFIGIALQDSNTGDKLDVMVEGLTPIGLFTNGQFIPGQEYYASTYPDISVAPSTSPQLKIGKAISSSQLFIYKH